MSEIFVEEENTVYELDEECMKRKEKMQQKQKEIIREIMVGGIKFAHMFFSRIKWLKI